MGIEGGQKTTCGKVFVCFVKLNEMGKGGKVRDSGGKGGRSVHLENGWEEM